MFQLYNELQQFPLFLGLGSAELTEIMAHTKFDFRKYEAGETVACAGEVCRHLHLLIGGKLQTTTLSVDRSYSVDEELEPPAIFQLERLFGLHQRFDSSYTALTPCSMILISKREVMRLTQTYVVCRMNLINHMATQAQKQSDRRWLPAPHSVEEHVGRFLKTHCNSPAGAKTFHIKMNRLANELNDSRLDISRALNRMQAQGLIALGREKIYIPQMERL